MILVTGSAGLIGRNLTTACARRGQPVRGFDIAASPGEDTRNADALAAALAGVEGVVHLAAVSRVIWAEQDRERCEQVNVGALQTLLRLCLAQRTRPWVIFASSREVYGQQPTLPVAEDAPFIPINIYARSKVAGERLTEEARAAGLRTAICRFSSVYGDVHDHRDRVTMAFAGAAARGGTMRIEGAQHTFDFTAVDDVVDGLLRLIEAVRSDERMPPVHFVSGVATSLMQLAQLAASHAVSPVTIEQAPERDFDVARFVGNPERAARLLGWRAATPVAVGVPRLIRALAAR